jgi:hypothetical protein
LTGEYAIPSEAMPVVAHPYVAQPSADTVICRFMDFDKFRDLFANEELYLRRTDLFKEEDPWEALPSDEYTRTKLRLRRDDPTDELRLINEQAFLRQNSEGYFITCWQIFDGETLHMWERYGKGVCIFSRFELMRAQLDRMLDPITTGIVVYHETQADPYNTIQFLFTKRGHFVNEKELRIVLQCYDPLGNPNRHLDADNVPSREPRDECNPLHSWVHHCKRRRIDLPALVAEIRLSPWATPAEFEEVGWWVKNKNLSCPITHSDCEGPLTPTPEELSKYGF